MIYGILFFLLAAWLLYLVLRHYLGKYEVVNEQSNRIVRGSFTRCYNYWGANNHRVLNWEIREIKK